MLFYVFTVKTHNHSLFRVLYDVVPGANAIRVGYRGMVVANLFAVTVIGLTFSRVVRLTNAVDYEQRAMRWAVNRRIAADLCRADIERGIWTVLP